ncbi:MAG: phospho-2-dehydro-3-deoxyheptonate aldolase [Candidatus Binatia bacterium]|nr:MAG: phospho-2-dehydro-3-deoxyheptonate aldolase [Candidatus Binatia bacterium]
MIIVMKSDIYPEDPAVRQVVQYAERFPGVRAEVRKIQGATRVLTEIYLIGPTATVPHEPFEEFEGVEKVIRIRERYRSIGRHDGQAEAVGFEYQGLRFSQDSFHLFPGLCAVDTKQNVEETFRALKSVGIVTTRAGAYKPRTSPYDFQGHGKHCLPWLFELAGKYGIKVIAMEVTHESHIGEIRRALQEAGNPTGVMLQIGTRNAQNFELLKAVGQQQDFPVLFKRGMGITLDESLNACEYLATSGNHRIVFCLRGMKTNWGDPHRNFVDFAHVPVVKRLTRLPVCIDPSHSVGKRTEAPDGLLDIFHATAQGIVAGANMVLVDFHPKPAEALCDGPQALLLSELEHFVRDAELVRRTYLERCRLREEMLERAA